MMRMTGEKRIFCHFLACAILSFFCLAGNTDASSLSSKIDIKPIKGNRTLPSLNLEDLKGTKVDLKGFKGKVIFLNFWATWCGPCKEEMPSMEAFYQRFKDRNFIFLTFSVDYEGPKPVREFIAKNRYTFPVFVDQKSEALDIFEVTGISTTFVIDKQWKLLGKDIGPRNWTSSEIVSYLTQLISQ
jgi:cytochrome c biogenesis protein CcmG/thiol:disulfide interchange protein DsbE